MNMSQPTFFAGMRKTPTKAQHLENWLGVEAVKRVSDAMRGFYAPVAMHGVPGTVFALPGGDFCGEIRAGSEVSAIERAADYLRRERRRRIGRQAMLRRELGAFSSLSALIAAASGGKQQNLLFQKNLPAANSIGNCMDAWGATAQPSAGAAAGAAPGGTAFNSTSAGALVFTNPSTANSSHFTTGYVTANVVNNSLLLYDRLFAVAKTMNSTATQAVSGVSTRYRSLTANASDYCGGNFVFPSNPTTVLAGTAHNWTVCQYTDQANTPTQNFPSIAGVSACVLRGVDLIIGNWFMPLAAGDTGVLDLTQMQCSALVATGTIDFVLGHPLAIMPCPIANLICVQDGINTAFNLTLVYDNAALAFLELPKPATTTTGYSGMITLVSE